MIGSCMLRVMSSRLLLPSGVTWGISTVRVRAMPRYIPRPNCCVCLDGCQRKMCRKEINHHANSLWRINQSINQSINLYFIQNFSRYPEGNGKQEKKHKREGKKPNHVQYSHGISSGWMDHHTVLTRNQCSKLLPTRRSDKAIFEVWLATMKRC